MIAMPNGTASSRTQALTAAEMQWLAVAEDVCRKLHLVIACPRCLSMGSQSGAVLRGANDPNDPSLSVTCDCRRMVFQKGSAGD